MPIHDWTRVEAGIFHDFHAEWIISLKHSLNQGVLPPDHYALAEQVSGGLHPNVLALERRLPSVPAGDSLPPPARGGGIALSLKPPQVRLTAKTDLERYARKRNHIVIRHISDDRVVAMLEIVSPGKASRHAMRSFVDKTLELLDAGIHLLLLDLFPPGSRDPQGIHGAIWAEICDTSFELPTNQPLTLVAYTGGAAPTAYIEPTAVTGVLPDMPLFLESDVYVLVPLETTYRTAFDAVPRRWSDVLESTP